MAALGTVTSSRVEVDAHAGASMPPSCTRVAAVKPAPRITTSPPARCASGETLSILGGPGGNTSIVTVAGNDLRPE